MTEIELDPQAFLAGAPEVVCRLRAALIERLEAEWPETTDAVLAAVDAVPHQEDRAAYLAAVIPVVTAALTAAVQPGIDALAAAAESARAEGRRLAEAHERFMQFWLMKTSGIQ